MVELRPILARRIGVLLRLSPRRAGGVLAHGRREAWPPHAIGLTLARRPRPGVAVAGRIELSVVRHTHTRIERLVHPAAPPHAAMPAAVPLTTSRLLPGLRERRLVMRTVREREEHSIRSRERLADRLAQDHEGERSARPTPAPEHSSDRPVVDDARANSAGNFGGDDAAARKRQLELVLRLPAVAAPASRPPAPGGSLELPGPAAPSSSAPHPATGALDAALSEPVLALVTEQVLRRIERRAIAQRERLGIV